MKTGKVNSMSVTISLGIPQRLIAATKCSQTGRAVALSFNP